MQKVSVFPPSTLNKVKPSLEGSILDHLLFCDHSPSFDDFNIFIHWTNKFFLEMKERLLIKRDKPKIKKHQLSFIIFIWLCIFVSFYLTVHHLIVLIVLYGKLFLPWYMQDFSEKTYRYDCFTRSKQGVTSFYNTDTHFVKKHLHMFT